VRRRITLPTLFAITALCSLAIAEESSAYDDYDAWLIESSTQESLENAKTDQTTHWANPDTGSSGAITPIQTYQNADGQYCREYQKTVTIGGREERAYGTACRMPDGHWQIVSGETAVAPPPTVVYRERVVYETVRVPAPRPYYNPWWGPVYAAAAVAPLAFHIGLDRHGHYGFRRGYYRAGYRGGHHRGGHFRRGYRGFRGHHRR
jgi:surface antigen